MYLTERRRCHDRTGFFNFTTIEMVGQMVGWFFFFFLYRTVLSTAGYIYPLLPPPFDFGSTVPCWDNQTYLQTLKMFP
jgi:hypothetical protein